MRLRPELGSGCADNQVHQPSHEPLFRNARIATSHFRERLAGEDGVMIAIRDEGKVTLIAVDHDDEGGLLITIEAKTGNRYLVRFEIGRGHIAIEAVPLDT